MSAILRQKPFFQEELFTGMLKQQKYIYGN